jgi:hypothetical protein
MTGEVMMFLALIGKSSSLARVTMFAPRLNQVKRKLLDVQFMFANIRAPAEGRGVYRTVRH